MATKRKKHSAGSDEHGRPSGDAYAARLADLRVATKVIGETQPERLAWVVGFVGEDPEAWHSAERTARGDCLVALARGGFPEWHHGGVKLPPPLSSEEIETLQGEMLELLHSVVNNPPNGPTVAIPTDGLLEGIVRMTSVGTKPALFALSYGDVPARTAVFQALKRLVLEAGERLLACPVCTAPFYAVRKQRFCSPRCAQKERNNRKARQSGKRQSGKKR